MGRIYFEDLVPGTVSTLGTKRVTEGEIVAFAQLYDPQPFHLGEESAKGTFVGRLIASGWHTIAMEMRVLCDAWLLDAVALGSPGIDKVEWLRPVLPGDELTIRQTIVDATPSRSRPEMGAVRFALETLNGAGEIVMRQENPILFACREHREAVANAASKPARVAAAERLEDLPGRDDGRSQLACGFDEVQIGATERLGEHLFLPPEIIAFASAYDPQPFHTDEEAARRSPLFGRLSASGWHTASVWMRHLVDSRQAALAAASSQGGEAPRFGPSAGFTDLRWWKPVLAGDTIRFATTATGKRPSRSRPGWGIVTNRNSGWNQDGEKVISFESSAFVSRAGG